MNEQLRIGNRLAEHTHYGCGNLPAGQNLGNPSPGGPRPLQIPSHDGNVVVVVRHDTSQVLKPKHVAQIVHSVRSEVLPSQSLANHVTPGCAHNWPKGLTPKFLPRGVSIPQVETPNSRETLSRVFNPTDSRSHQSGHVPGTRHRPGPAYWPLPVILNCLAGLMYDTFVERTPTNRTLYVSVPHPRVSCPVTVGWFLTFLYVRKEVLGRFIPGCS